MNFYPLLALLVFVYAGFVIAIAIMKPDKIWNMKKIEGFRKVLGDKGTVIFFYVWAVLFIILGGWLFTL